jgi:hypothetical protein
LQALVQAGRAKVLSGCHSGLVKARRLFDLLANMLLSERSIEVLLVLLESVVHQ